MHDLYSRGGASASYSALFLPSAPRLPAGVKTEVPWGGEYGGGGPEFGHHALDRAAYGGHPYSNMTTGTPQLLFPV